MTAPQRDPERSLSVGRAVLLGGLGVLFALPLVWLLATSLRPAEEIAAARTLTGFWPRRPTLDNYRQALNLVPFGRFYLNTLLVTGLSVAGTTVSSALAAFAFSHLRWPGRDALFAVLIATMLLPGQVTMVPVYLIFAKLGWVGSLKPLWVPSLFGTAFYIFLLRQFMRGVPRELIEAAQLEGASWGRVFWTVVLPLVRPALLTVALFQTLASWNDFLNPLIYLHRQQQMTLTLGLQSFVSAHATEWGPLMAATVLMLAPVVALFFLAQRTLVRGVTFDGLKD